MAKAFAMVISLTVLFSCVTRIVRSEDSFSPNPMVLKVGESIDTTPPYQGWFYLTEDTNVAEISPEGTRVQAFGQTLYYGPRITSIKAQDENGDTHHNLGEIHVYASVLPSDESCVEDAPSEGDTFQLVAGGVIVDFAAHGTVTLHNFTGTSGSGGRAVTVTVKLAARAPSPNATTMTRTLYPGQTCCCQITADDSYLYVAQGDYQAVAQLTWSAQWTGGSDVGRPCGDSNTFEVIR